MKRYKNRYANITLSSMLVIVISITAFCAMIISSLLLFSRFNSIVKESAETTTIQAVGNITKGIETFTENMIETLDNIEYIVENNDSNDEMLAELQTVYDLRSDLVSIVIYHEDGSLAECVTKENYLIKENIVGNNLSFHENILGNEGRNYISSPHVSNIFYRQYPWVVTVSSIVNSKNHGRVVVTMDVEFSGIAKYVDYSSIGDRGYLYIVDNKGDIVYHPQQQLIYLGLKEEIELPNYINGQTFTDDNNIISAQAVENSDWNVVGVSYTNDLVAVNTREFIMFTAVLLIFGAIVFVFLGIILSRGLSNPINQLVQSMKEFEKNVSTFKRKEIKGFSEVQQLSQSFEHMAKRIQTLMEKIKNEEKELRKVELKALQAQINPHFLYNTLDSILWMCQENGNEDAAEMVGALAKLFRISISRGKDMISIETELKHVESYLFIQSIRYKNQFTYRFEVDEDVLKCKCLKIILQPFVENAIYHGIDRMVDEGEIVITGKREGDAIVLKVKDNGIGMSEELASALFVENSEKAGVGVKNVHNRIRIYHGDEYGISIKSELDEGTDMIITIPIIEENE